MSNPARIPFEEAIEEPLLFKNVWYGTGKAHDHGFTAPQRMVLKAIYGLALTDEEKEAWDALNGGAVYDHLGYIVGTPTPFDYQPGIEMRDITLILGRRWAKTTIESFVLAYEALCGGHHTYLGRAERQVPHFIQIAQDLDTAKTNLRQHILSFLEASPLGRKELGNLQDSVTATEIRLKRALIEVAAPTIKVRGKAVAIVAFDELGFWPKDVGSAAQDIEIERAVKPAMTQFPDRKLLKTSSPTIKLGLLWQAAELGTYGRFKGSPPAHRTTLVLQGPTALSQNPTIKREELALEQAKDPDNYRREYLAEFTDSLSGFLDPGALRAAMKEGIKVRKHDPRFLYVAGMDAAFRHDAFTFSIAHMEDGAFVQDVLVKWQGAAAAPLSPTRILHEVARWCKAYGLSMVLSDQHHLESLQELALSVGLVIEPFIITNDTKRVLCADFALMLNQGKLRLLDHEELFAECAALERLITPSGNVQYVGRRDDHFMVTVLVLHRALQTGEARGARADKPATNHGEAWWNHQRRATKTENHAWWA